MSRIVDFLRNNLFWVLMVLAVGGIACIHVFVARRMASDVDVLRHKGTRVVESLRDLANKSSIPNKEMKKVAEKEEAGLKVLHGQLFVMFASRSGVFDREFEAMKSGLPLEQAVHKWWLEYRVMADALLARAKTHFRATDTVFKIDPTPASPKANRKVIKQNENVFWRLQYTVDALIYATANTKTERPPLITKLQFVELVGPARSKRPWVRGTKVKIRAEMAYENIGLLVAALQNSPKPLFVRSIAATLPGTPGDAALPAGDLSTTMNVVLSCEIVEFRPVVKQVTFGGPRFAKSDTVKKWVKEQERDLHIATAALLERVSGLEERAEALLGAKLTTNARRKAGEARDRELAKIDAGAAAKLAAMIEAAKENNKITPARKAAAEKEHADSIAKEKEAAQKRYRRAGLHITAKAVGFSLIYDHLRPIVAQKAYFVGLKSTRENIVIAKAPHSANAWADKWWMAQQVKDGKYWPSRGNKRRRVREIIQEIQDGTPGMVAIRVDPGSVDAPVLFAKKDNKGKLEMVQMLVSEPKGGWRVYEIVRADGKPVSLGDVAFRFAPVISAVAPVIDTGAFKRASKRVMLPSKRIKPGETFVINVLDGAGGTITVATGLRQ